MSPAVIEPAENGYVATFHGQISHEAIDDVRAWAFEEYSERPLRWAVMDLSDATPVPVVTLEDEEGEIAALDRVARGVRDAKTDSLRLAIVADATTFGSLIQLMAFIVERGGVRNATIREIERFDELAAALAWAKADE